MGMTFNSKTDNVQLWPLGRHLLFHLLLSLSLFLQQVSLPLLISLRLILGPQSKHMHIKELLRKLVLLELFEYGEIGPSKNSSKELWRPCD